ncbi:sporulation integral membrane protein YtvI [Sporosarcina sp. ACRSL]|uniref:sporulation integral membrane protein YtvI n=1 Tax=Sporosarcina sp. ACRSL TaxID=2918215 RepID=UPI001EF62EAA|nr:sporulation integral membrane protein YtvI [Sporosarcina sp. ACRSL]MCG7342752.1 sporulation integral membrane protein YtvI [Sporosarcina sp. ACRSL]
MARWLTKRNIVLFTLLIIVILIFIFILPVSVPIILALFTALLFEPLVKLTQVKFKWKRNVAVISVYIFIMAILAAAIYYTVTSLIGRLIKFTKAAPDYVNKLSGVWIDFQNKLLVYTSALPNDVVKSAQGSFNDILESFKNSLLEVFNSDKIVALASEIPNFLVSLIFYMIALFLFMLELPELKKMVFRHFTDETAKKVRYMTVKLNSVVIGFIKAQLLVSLIILAVTFVGLLTIAPKYALVMSIIIWVIDILPILGGIIILVPWSLYHYVSGDFGMGTKLAVLAAVLMIIRRTIEPKMMGNQIGLAPLPTLIAMFVGLKLFGVLGLFIGPMIVILFITAREAGIIKLNFKI